MEFEWDASLLGLDDSEEPETSPDPVPVAPAPVQVAPTRKEVPMTTQPKMTEVERRLEMAYYYRLLLNDSLFVDANSEIAQVVESEIRQFVQERLEILLGIRVVQPKAVEQFDRAEALVLKTLAKKLLTKATEAPVEEPAAAAAPTPAPVVPLGPPARKRSGIRKVSANDIDAPPKPVKTEAPVAAQTPSIQTAPQKPAEAPQSVESASDDSEYVEVEVNGQMMRRRKSKRQVRPPGAVAMPSPTHLEQIAHQEAAQFGSGIIGLAVQAALTQQ